jgi:DNA-binding beta-propeller fold protein YncE
MTGQGHLLATHPSENWARIIDPLANTVLAEMPIGGHAHGDAYNAATGRAFVACDEGIDVIDTVSMMKTARLPYPAAGRSSFLYHSGETPTAVGLHNLSADGERQETDSFLLIDMANEAVEAISIPGASLDWSSRDGHFALSKDGRTAVFSDLNASRIYVVDVDPASDAFRSVRTIQAPAPGVAVGVGERGAHLFVLSGTMVYPVDLDHGEVNMADAFAVKEGTDWIYVTSFSGEILDDSVDRGDAILNPEDAISGV